MRDLDGRDEPDFFAMVAKEAGDALLGWAEVGESVGQAVVSAISAVRQ